ncbi:MAG: septum site-determining protein MinC [Myxococcales bacterium]|nr:septum site-determining protein MinC [Myxococcales bacterium]
MDSSNALLEVAAADARSAPPIVVEDARPAAVLRGTARGLEVFIHGTAAIDAIVAAWVKRLEEAPGFFRGSDVRVRVEDGPLAAGCLARLDEIATRFELRIIEVSAAKRAADSDAVPQPSLAAGSAPSPATASATAFDDEPTGSASIANVIAPPDAALVDTALHMEPAVLADSDLTELIELLQEPAAVPGMTFEEPTQTAVPLSLAATAEVQLETTSGTRLVVGPVRSGVILEHAGHLIVFGDVNPGAEIRAQGNIVVLGRLRGTAHAGIGQEVGFILSLRLEPQQLRIGRKVARAADSDVAASEAEIAYCTGDQIVVERYQGKLPRNLATSI